MGSVSLAQMFDGCGTMGAQQLKAAPSGSHRPTPAHPLTQPGVSVMEPSMPVPGDNTPEPR